MTEQLVDLWVEEARQEAQEVQGDRAVLAEVVQSTHHLTAPLMALEGLVDHVVEDLEIMD